MTDVCGLPKKEKEEEADFFFFFFFSVWQKVCLINTMPAKVIYISFLKSFDSSVYHFSFLIVSLLNFSIL